MKNFNYIVEQLWYQITCPIVAWYERITFRINAWLEWEDAKCWAREYHPGWLHCFKKCKHKATQAHYKAKILAAYRGEDE